MKTHSSTIQITDTSCVGIEVAIFGESSDDMFDIGKQISFISTVSGWNTLSLNTNAGAFHDNNTDKTNLAEWWISCGRGKDIKSVSTFERKMGQFHSVKDMFALSNGTRVAAEGFLTLEESTFFLEDDTGKIEIKAHNANLEVTDTKIKINNALVESQASGYKLVVFCDSFETNE